MLTYLLIKIYIIMICNVYIYIINNYRIEIFYKNMAKKIKNCNYIYNMIELFSYVKNRNEGEGYEEDIYSYYIYRYTFILSN